MNLRITLFAVAFASPASAAPLDDAQTAWANAWADKPALVSLGELGGLDGGPEQIESVLKQHLRGLGRKTFSNREWKAYWRRQQTTATVFSKALTQDGQEQLALALRSWAKLAEDKIRNQDAYLAAIEMERDALEKRLEASVTESTPKHETETEIDESFALSPFEERQRLVAGLQRDLKMQEWRTLRAEQGIKLIARQKLAAGQLLKALERDVVLARIEASISAQETASPVVAWASLWAPIAAGSLSKSGKLIDEAKLGTLRMRTLNIEETLTNSQIDYREAKITRIKTKVEAATSLQGWTEAITATAKRWVTESLWKVLLSLLGIWLLLKLALRLVSRLSRTLEHVADDGDDDFTTQSEQRAGTIAAVFSGIARVAIYAVAVLTGLEVIGINTGPIVGSVAILGLAISFGSQNLVKDLVNGFFILIENQYAVGDVVSIGGATGTVEKINLRSTRIRQYDGTLHVIPNGAIESVANLTRDWARCVLTVGVAYDADLGLVEKVVNQVGADLFSDDEWAPQLEDAPSYVGVVALADSSVNVRCIARTTPGSQWAVDREFQRRIKDAFDAAGIEIPYPQRVMRTL
jgi:small-conductance mechanosensitive channel